MVYMCINGSKRPSRKDHIPSKYHVFIYRLVQGIGPRRVQFENWEDRIEWHENKQSGEKRQSKNKIPYARMSIRPNAAHANDHRAEQLTASDTSHVLATTLAVRSVPYGRLRNSVCIA